MIEKQFDISFISELALREKQIQQNYRPVIAVHKWFARRPGTLFRGLLLSEFAGIPLRESFYQPNCLQGIRVADPFMGGGTPLLEANRAGCDVIGFDINPMSWWIVKQEIEHLDLDAYTCTAENLRTALEQKIGHLYRTRCVLCGTEGASVKYFLWVKVIPCRECGTEIKLFPGYLLSADARHPNKPGAPLAFTYHHNRIEAYYPIAVAILDAGLVCSASLPCPAEMGASIHINGTGSSIVDTVLVCRSTGTVSRTTLAASPADVARLIENDLALLRRGNVKPTPGDMRCIAYGHLIRLAIWSLRHDWDKEKNTESRIADVAKWIEHFGGWSIVEGHLNQAGNKNTAADYGPLFVAQKNDASYKSEEDDVSFYCQNPASACGMHETKRIFHKI